MRNLFLTLTLLYLSLACDAQKALDCEAAFDAIYGSWDNIRNMQYKSEKTERHKTTTVQAEMDFTIQRSPFKVAGRMADKGHWVLYDPKVSIDHALLISNGFPYTNLNLDINGSIFRGLNHYTISDAGCEFVFEIIRREYERIPDNFNCTEVMRDGRKEWLLRAETDAFTFKPYKAQPGETVLDIAKKLSVSAYLILERNSNITGYLDVCTGLTLMVPSHYGKIVEIYFDAGHKMPTRIEIHDEKGMFERFDYSNYKFNVGLDAAFFTEEHLDDLN
jgi:outer membrane lipoprotein-sorting protein